MKGKTLKGSRDVKEGIICFIVLSSLGVRGGVVEHSCKDREEEREKAKEREGY